MTALFFTVDSPLFLFIVLYRKGHGRDHLTLSLWHRGSKGPWITPGLKALTFLRHGHSLVDNQSAGSGNYPGCCGRSQPQSSCGCPGHIHQGLGGESRVVKRILMALEPSLNHSHQHCEPGFCAAVRAKSTAVQSHLPHLTTATQQQGPGSAGFSE